MKLYDQYKELVTNDTPLIDLRAPVEFKKGAFREAINLPILTDRQRDLVGKKYKEEGKQAAIKLGVELTRLDKNEKIKKWLDFLENNPKVVLYCFRGGQRSKIAQEWIYKESGLVVPRLKRGYKAFRNFLIDSLMPKYQNYQPYRLGGLTGVGKTIFLHNMEEIIDLEALANHRGSIFGPKISPQPRQIDFENNLAYDLINQQNRGHKFLVFEDEGIHVGKSFLPKDFHEFLSRSPLVVLEANFDQRVENIMQEYVYDEQREYKKVFGSQGLDKWHRYISKSITKAKNKLGGKRYQELIDIVNTSVQKQKEGKGAEGHKDWISRFLSNYYDPMYKYQLKKGLDKVVFKGNKAEVKEFFDHERNEYK